jgi:hypothetical protein
VSWSTVRGAPVAALERAAAVVSPSSGVSRQSSHISGVSLQSHTATRATGLWRLHLTCCESKRAPPHTDSESTATSMLYYTFDTIPYVRLHLHHRERLEHAPIGRDVGQPLPLVVRERHATWGQRRARPCAASTAPSTPHQRQRRHRRAVRAPARLGQSAVTAAWPTNRLGALTASARPSRRLGRPALAAAWVAC